MRTFRDAIRHDDLVVTAELPLLPTTIAADISDAASILSAAVDAVQIGDNRNLPGHMSPIAAASVAIASGLDAIAHLSCRDRNRIALRADILGAVALGVTSLLLARGEKLPDRAAVGAKGVFDTSGTQLIALASQVPGVLVGSFATVFDPSEDWEATRIDEKLEAGARFLQTQPCLNAELLRKYVDKLIERKVMHRASLIVDVPLLTSPQQARLLKSTYKGAPVPDEAIQRIMAADDTVSEGISVCAEMLTELRVMRGISGVNIQYHGEPQDVVAAIREAGLLRQV